MTGRNDERLRCSFCGKTQDQVRKLIAGPNGAYICDECVDVCAEIIDEELESTSLARIKRRKFCPLQFIIITRELWQDQIQM